MMYCDRLESGGTLHSPAMPSLSTRLATLGVAAPPPRSWRDTGNRLAVEHAANPLVRTRIAMCCQRTIAEASSGFVQVVAAFALSGRVVRAVRRAITLASGTTTNRSIASARARCAWRMISFRKARSARYASRFRFSMSYLPMEKWRPPAWRRPLCGARRRATPPVRARDARASPLTSAATTEICGTGRQTSTSAGSRAWTSASPGRSSAIVPVAGR